MDERELIAQAPDGSVVKLILEGSGSLEGMTSDGKYVREEIDASQIIRVEEAPEGAVPTVWIGEPPQTS